MGNLFNVQYPIRCPKCNEDIQSLLQHANHNQRCNGLPLFRVLLAILGVAS